ncbi:hypothetical protein B9Z55_016880 [Caenorhabditis nigoni]|nr:hypothetical protein B9Z55_016880 [Caenorhabditis nigoni]
MLLFSVNSFFGLSRRSSLSIHQQTDLFRRCSNLPRSFTQNIKKSDSVESTVTFLSLGMFWRKFFFLVCFGALVLGTCFYIFLFLEAGFTVILDGGKVNFTGVEDFIPPNVNIVSDFFVASDYKMMSCGIRKSMSQLTINAMCLLHDEENFLKENHNFNETWATNQACQTDQEFRTPSNDLLNNNETIRFAFIRDPIDRFVSLYLDKCVNEHSCWACDIDMRCVVQEIYKGLKLLLETNKDPKPIPTYMDWHAAPLSWNCNFDKDLSKWTFLMMGPDVEERKSSILQLGNIMKRQGVSEKLLQMVQEQALAGETAHATHKSTRRLEAERQVREDPVVRDYLHKIYFFDYLVFPFNRKNLDAKYQTDFWKVPEQNGTTSSM